MTGVIIFAAVILTSVLSGIIGMAGGIVLMALLVLLLPVPAAMALHGAVQATANGSRAWFLRHHIQWRVLPPYLLGATAAASLFLWFMLVPAAGVVLILVGLFPWLTRLLPHLRGLDITRWNTAVACGLVVTSAQLVAGASGPLLDVFYLSSPLTRHQIVASKALTQVIGHLLKVIYYGSLAGLAGAVPLWWVPVAMACAVAGTRLGTRLLDRLPETRFRLWSNRIILALGLLCIVRGSMQLLAQTPP